MKVAARAAGFRVPRGGPVKARPAPLAPAQSVNSAFKAIIAAGLAHLLANERGLLKGADPEYLHQARVALRRLRSALGVFSPPLVKSVTQPMARELRWLASCLGPARDWDVFVSETLRPIETEFGAHAGLVAIRARCRTLRRNAGARGRRAVRSSRYRKVTQSLAAWVASEGWLARLNRPARAALDRPIGDHAQRVLEARYRRICKRGRGLGELSAAELHRLRIAIKKFRYAADFFSGLYGGRPVRETLRRLSRLQDVLGAINDSAMAADLTAQGCRGARDGNVLEARGIMLGWSRGRAATLKRELSGAWKEFRSAGRFW